MKNALLKDTFREIKNSIGRFLSIFTIVALGCGFFSGIKATMPDMIDAAEKYFEQTNLMDVKLMSTIGVRSEDVEAIKKSDIVKGVMAGYSKDVYYSYKNRNVVLKFMSYNDKLDDSSPNKLNKPVLIQGRYPEKEGECLIEVKASSPDTFKIGNTLEVSEPDNSKKLSDTLSVQKYKIVGIATSPLYIGYKRDATNVGDGNIVSNVYVPEYNFVCDYYTDIYIKFFDTENYNPFLDSYKEKVNELTYNVLDVFKNSVDLRYKKMINDASDKLESAKSNVSILEKYLSLNLSELYVAKKNIQHDISQAKKKYDSLENGTLSKQLAESAVIKAEHAGKIIDDLIEDKEKQNDENHQIYLNQLNDAKSQVARSEEQIKNQKEPQFYTFNRFELSSDYSSFYNDSQKVDSIAKIFPVFFIIVAALVCLTTMSRMIEEQRIQVGTYKALGYSISQIAGKYLFYSELSTILGSCIGSVLGLQIFPSIIFKCYKMLYNIPSFKSSFRPLYVVLCVLVSTICICITVVYACAKEFKSEPSELMRPKAPLNGKRVFLEKIGFIWNRLSFLEKVTIRNLFRYKKRFLMTLFGVAGCTALIITGFGLKNSIKTIADKQFEDIFVYDGLVVMDSSNYKEDELENKISSFKEIDKYLLAQSTDVKVLKDDVNQSAAIIVAKDPDRLDDFVKLKSVKGDQEYKLENGKVIITEKLSKLLGISVGDDFRVKSEGEKDITLTVGAISKNYTMHYVYMNPETYIQIYGKSPSYNVSFINLKKNVDHDDFKSKLISNKEFLGMSYKYDSAKGFMDSVNSLNSIVVLLILCAGGLAVVVLYNLANINITERVREIATVKVLGFYDNETSSYICNENYISSVIGILIGFIAGKILHYFVVITSEVDVVMFNRELVWWAYMIGALMTISFTVIVNIILYFKLKKVDMVESLKSVE